MRNLEYDRVGKKLIVIGAGDLARAVRSWFPELQIHGYLGTASMAGHPPYLGPLLGDADLYIPKPDEVYICAISSNVTRLAIARRFEELGAQFISLIHPTAVVAQHMSLGAGSVVLPGAILDFNCRVGRHAVLYFRSGIGHDSLVGDGCNVLTHGVIGAHCTVGEGCTVSTLGFCNSGVNMGPFSLVAANSFAGRDVPAGFTAIGVPARNIPGGQKLPSRSQSSDRVEQSDSVAC